MYEQMKKNNVSSANQLPRKHAVEFDNVGGNGIRILFAGNSITLHGVKEEIGWHLRCGMAASCPENDYVHILERKVLEKNGEATFCIGQVAEWEGKYAKDNEICYQYEKIRDFKADVIIARFIENCSSINYDADIFKTEYERFIDYLNSTGKAKVILTTGFWKHPGDEVIKKIGEERGYPVVYLGDLGEDDSMKAIGLFEHNGVANHPGDKGMAAIAEKIWKELEPLVD